MENDTSTSNTQAASNYCLAADDIMKLLDQLGFSSAIPVNGQSVKAEIVNAIRNRVEGNIRHEITTETNDLVETEQEILDKIVDEIAEDLLAYGDCNREYNEQQTEE